MRQLPLLATLGAAILWACGESKPGAVGARPQAKPGVVAAAPVFDAGTADPGQAYVYTYQPMGKRDPFRSPVQDIKLTGGGNTTCTEPLCQWDLDQLALVAVVTGDANPIAMVQDPQSRGYIIRRGTKIGKQGGQVTQILRDTVTVTEYFQSPDGKRNPNPVTMHMKADALTAPNLDLLTGKNLE